MLFVLVFELHSASRYLRKSCSLSPFCSLCNLVRCCKVLENTVFFRYVLHLCASSDLILYLTDCESNYLAFSFKASKECCQHDLLTLGKWTYKRLDFKVCCQSDTNFLIWGTFWTANSIMLTLLLFYHLNIIIDIRSEICYRFID